MRAYLIHNNAADLVVIPETGVAFHVAEKASPHALASFFGDDPCFASWVSRFFDPDLEEMYDIDDAEAERAAVEEAFGMVIAVRDDAEPHATILDVAALLERSRFHGVKVL